MDPWRDKAKYSLRRASLKVMILKQETRGQGQLAKNFPVRILANSWPAPTAQEKGAGFGWEHPFGTQAGSGFQAQHWLYKGPHTHSASLTLGHLWVPRK